MIVTTGRGKQELTKCQHGTEEGAIQGCHVGRLGGEEVVDQEVCQGKAPVVLRPPQALVSGSPIMIGSDHSVI